jgi:hypothetical protein
MKRMNRKKILEVLETARQGYSSLVFKAREIGDKIMEISCQAHHGMLNEQIVELGGESVDAPLLFKRYCLEGRRRLRYVYRKCLH